MTNVVELTKIFDFEAAHFLPNVAPGHKCGRVHGHSYEVHITIRETVDPFSGMGMDFGDFKVVVKPLIDSLDHQLLNEIRGLSNPTSENLSIWLWDELSQLDLVSITVKETQSSACTYRGERV